ncbi:hypothetical protein KI387_041919, partial [Taxus chinensis]
HSTMFGTVLNYVTLRLLGQGSDGGDKEAMEKGRVWILGHGSATAIPSKGIALNPITSLYYVAPCCLVFLTVPWLFVEFPLLKDNSTFHLDYVVFGTNSVCAFALNLAVFLLIGKTSALTMNVDNSALKQRIAALAQDKIFFF